MLEATEVLIRDFAGTSCAYVYAVPLGFGDGSGIRWRADVVPVRTRGIHENRVLKPRPHDVLLEKAFG